MTLVTYVLRQGDRALILAQRLLEEITHAPEIEEDMALSNLALDLIGQARGLYTYAGGLEGPADDGHVRTEDHYAYWREQHEFLNPLLVEQPNDDFAHLIARQFLHDAMALPYWQAMTNSADDTLAGLAGKAVKETAYHLRHSRGWVVRLGDGTDESHRRMQAAIDHLWRYTGELFEHDHVEDELIADGVAADPESVRAEWRRVVDEALGEARLEAPDDGVMQTGGRHGRHSEGFSYLIGELQVLARAHPGASW
ncbi:MAG: 1,2-phenylacetyl-CoA epoxidase subunit PaaC [Ilumatobacteraceae bacterium]|nr:1,2-phenylacetyl-CoA epoxidase subunit PaaC [Ilumatobacteraceae bacterium]